MDGGYLELVKKMLDSGADPDVYDAVSRFWLTNVVATAYPTYVYQYTCR